MKFVGLHLHEDDAGVPCLTAYLDFGVVQLVPAREDMDRAPGWYTMAWEPATDPPQPVPRGRNRRFSAARAR